MAFFLSDEFLMYESTSIAHKRSNVSGQVSYGAQSSSKLLAREMKKLLVDTAFMLLQASETTNGRTEI